MTDGRAIFLLFGSILVILFSGCTSVSVEADGKGAEKKRARARQLVIAIEDTPSKRLAMLMSEDLGELLQENLPAT